MTRRYSPEWKAKISASLKGRGLPESTRAKMSIAHKGKVPSNVWKKGCPSPYTKGHPGPSNPNRKVGLASYGSIHKWVRRQLGKASAHVCVTCGKPAHHWANKSHQYKRDLEDWTPMCRRCHRIYDLSTWGDATRRFGLGKTALQEKGFTIKVIESS